MRPRSIIELSENLKSVYIEKAQKLKGSDRRQFMAAVVKELGIGGQIFAEQELGWNRCTIRKGMQELETGKPFIDGFQRSGRKRAEVKLPNLLKDIKSIVDPQIQTAPSVKSTQLYTRITASEVRRQLIAQYGYTDEELPSSETIRRKLNDLGYCKNWKTNALIKWLILQGYCNFVVIPPANTLRATPENPLKWVKTIDTIDRSAEWGCRIKAGSIVRLRGDAMFNPRVFAKPYKISCKGRVASKLCSSEN